MLTTIFIILLIISQLFCFYIIVLLNAKVAKFKDLEIRQEQLMREMEESFSLYLVEIREENDRLIKELSKTNSKQSSNINYLVQNKNTDPSPLNNAEEQKIIINESNTDSTNNTIDQKVFVPKVIARNAYNKYKSQSNNNEPIDKNETKSEKSIAVPLSFEQQVIQLHNEGKNIEEIAKLTKKGKTEIELLLKFHA